MHLLAPPPSKKYRSSLCVITNTDDLQKAAEIIDSSYVTVAVVHPSVTADDLAKKIDRVSINIMTRDEYLAASNWHFDHTM